MATRQEVSAARQSIIVLIVFAIAMLIVFVRSAHAQGVSMTALWDPNPASENVLSYIATIDGKSETLSASAICSATCAYRLPAFPSGSAHTFSVAAINAQGQSPSSTLSFRIGAVSGLPTRPPNVRIVPASP